MTFPFHRSVLLPVFIPGMACSFILCDLGKLLQRVLRELNIAEILNARVIFK